MTAKRTLDFGSPRTKRLRTTSGGNYVVVTPSPTRSTPCTMSKYSVVRKYAGRAWKSKYGRSLRSRAKSAGTRYAKRVGRRGLSRLRRGRSRRRLVGMSYAGEAPNSQGNKHLNLVVDTAASDMEPYKLYSRNLIQIPPQTSAHEDNLREGRQVDVKGVKINALYINNSSISSIVLNMAILIPKEGLSTVTNLTEEGFFRGDDGIRGVDMGIANSALLHNTRAINTDRYHILFRKRMRIMLGVIPGEVFNQGKWVRSFKKYIPINRQFRFLSDTETAGQDPFWCMWYDDLERSGASTGPFSVENARLSAQEEISIIYKDVQ